MKNKICPSCGGAFEDISGPVHTYLSTTPACWARFGQALALHYSDYRYWSAHQLLTDGYSLQHSNNDDPRAVRSARIHLAALYAQLVLNQPEQRIVALRKAIAKHAPAHPIVPWPEPTISIENVELTNPSGHLKSVVSYARTVLADWREHHELAHKLCRI